jgi:hypothetical protein
MESQSSQEQDINKNLSNLLGRYNWSKRYIKNMKDETSDSIKNQRNKLKNDLEPLKSEIISTLNNPALDLGIIDKTKRTSYLRSHKDIIDSGTPYILHEILDTRDDNIIDTYLNLYNPYLTSDILTMIRRFMVYELGQENMIKNLNTFISMIQKIELKKENFPNLQNFWEKKLDMADNFERDRDISILLTLIDNYNKTKTRLTENYNLYYSYFLPDELTFYKNTILSILNNPNLDLGTGSHYLILRGIAQMNDNDVITAYLNNPTLYISDKELAHEKSYRTISADFVRQIKNKLIQNKALDLLGMQPKNSTRNFYFPPELRAHMQGYSDKGYKYAPTINTRSDNVISNAIESASSNPQVNPVSDNQVNPDNSSSNASGGRRTMKRRKINNRKINNRKTSRKTRKTSRKTRKTSRKTRRKTIK